MEESDWTGGNNPSTLIEFLSTRTSPFRTRWQGMTTIRDHSFSQRKEILFASACIRRLNVWLPPIWLDWLDQVERLLDTNTMIPPVPIFDIHEAIEPLVVDPLTREHVADAMLRMAGGFGTRAFEPQQVSDSVARAHARDGLNAALREWLSEQQRRGITPSHIPQTVMDAAFERGYTTEAAIHSDYLRDVVMNPFQRIEFLPRWRTADATAIAKQLYNDNDFVGMPILADALEEAGCDDPRILGHCRRQSRHVRGCWVIDQILCRN